MIKFNFCRPALRMLKVGMRCVGLDKGDFYSCIVAEVAKFANKNRYLVFFDNG
jgi:hypothetical protein